jgi:hypothetical protein
MTSLFFKEDEEEAVKQEALKRNRVTSLAGVFAKTLSVLTTHKITVNVVDRKEISAPAYSSTREVFLNLPQIKDDFSSRSITSLNGLSFHELGHLRYTPRNGSKLVQLIQENQKKNELWQAFNCLEDSRIEFLLTGWLPSIKSWLTATMVDYLLSDSDSIERAFPLVYGRKYLPVELRQLASDSFIKPEIQQDFADVIDEYNSLVLTGNDELTERAFTLVKRFAELLEELPALPQDPNGSGEGESTTVIVRIKNPHGHDSRPTQGYESSSNRPASKKEQERNQQQAKKNVVEVVIDTTPKEDTKEDESAEQNNQPEVQKPEGDNSADNSKEDSFGDEFGDEFGDDEVDSPQSTPSKPSRNAGNEAGDTGSNQQVTDTLNDILKDVIDSLSKDINDIANQIGVVSDLDGGNAKTPDKARYNEISVPADLVTLAKQFGVELERLRADFDPAWVGGERAGKLNAQRYLLGADLDSVFDEWTEGRDDVCSIEAVILLDRSGSMDGKNADSAYKSMWAIKKSLERVEARTTVVTFDSRTNLLYGADEKAGITIRDAGADGGTNPQDSLLYAKRVLAESDKAIKILFMITDGAWNTEEGERAVKEMKQAGVLTCQALITGYELNAEQLNNYRHSFELMTSIKSAKDILILGKELVRLSIARNLVNA